MGAVWIAVGFVAGAAATVCALVLAVRELEIEAEEAEEAEEEHSW